MIKRKPVCFKPHDTVLFKGKEAVVLEVNGTRAMLHCPEFDPDNPYIVCEMEILVPSPIKTWPC